MPGFRAPRAVADRSSPSLGVALLVVSVAAGCAHSLSPSSGGGRLRWVSSSATQASWAFVVDDRARGAELLVDGRLRDQGCNRQGRNVRCELRGLFPGGHTVEVRLPGAVMKRSVVVGRDWPAWPALVRVRTPEDAKEAARAGADAVIAADALGMEALQDIAEAAHAEGVRVFVEGGASAIELAAADGVIGAAVPPALQERFPEAMGLSGLPEAHGVVEAALAFAGKAGAIVDRAAFPLLQPRKRHAALRGGTVETSTDGKHTTTVLRTRGDELVLLVNAAGEPWAARVDQVAAPIDLLGSTVENGVVNVRANDVAMVVRSPVPDRTRY